MCVIVCACESVSVCQQQHWLQHIPKGGGLPPSLLLRVREELMDVWELIVLCLTAVALSLIQVTALQQQQQQQTAAAAAAVAAAVTRTRDRPQQQTHTAASAA